jgi:CHAT domain-containing protein
LGCHALIIEASRDQPLVVSLPGLSLEEAAAHAEKMLDALAGTSDPGKDRHDLLDVLDWLWDLIAAPALTALGHTSNTASESPLPHVWWCPTGPLAIMPVHAAGHHPRQRSAAISGLDCVLRRVISSYTPTLAALTRARQPATPSTVRQLTIGMPYTPGQQPLPAVPDEMRILASHFPPGAGNHQITGRQATRTSALAAISSHSWIHLACHASQLHEDPASSGFALYDGMLSITDLASQPTKHRDLAFLSACQTAAGSARLTDEAVHLAAAMQFLGYRHVIATLWTITDSQAPHIADAVYTVITQDGRPDPGRAAEALHHAVQDLRAHHPANPVLWAPYIHLGP